MPIGPEDYIDQLLVKKYQDQKMDNHEDMESLVSPEKMLDAMRDQAEMYKNIVTMKQRLNIACYAVNARAARYLKTSRY